MPANAERQLARLRARFHGKALELSEMGFLLRGTLLQRFKRCGSPGCGCHADPTKLHGPYWQWTSKVKGKTITRMLNEAQVRRYRAWMDNAQRFDHVIDELHDLSARADQILTELERQPSERKERASSRRARSRP
jgi:hypothetical protein